jgi:hypothetical protein
MSRWMSLTFLTCHISVMVEILSGFASMPCLVMMYPWSLPQGTPKVHFFRVQLDVEAPEDFEGFFQVSYEGATLSGFHEDVIDVDIQIAPYLPFETEMHTSLVAGPCVL